MSSPISSCLSRGAAPEDRSAPSFLLDLSLELDAAGVRGAFGAPAHSTVAPHFCVYDYHEFETGEFGWSFVFETMGERVVCVTRRFSAPQDLSQVFPPVATERKESRGAAALVRSLDANRVLIGIGSQQLVLMRPTVVKRFFPWVVV